MLRRIIKLGLSIGSFGGLLAFLVLATEWNIPAVRLSMLDAWQPGSGLVKYSSIILALILLNSFLYAIAKRWLPAGDTMTIRRIQPAESKYMPTYIGLFVIAFELANIPSTPRLSVIVLLFVFWLLLENTAYFNPFMLLVGLRFYEVESTQGVMFTVISKKKDIKQMDRFKNLTRISNFVYLESTN